MVTRSALQNAASIAKNILTTEAIGAEVPEKEGAGVGGRVSDMSGTMRRAFSASAVTARARHDAGSRRLCSASGLQGC